MTDIRDELSPRFLARIAEARRRRESLLRSVALRAEFPRIANPAHTLLAALIKRRKAAGTWPPRDVDSDPELQELLPAVTAESRRMTICGPEFEMAVQINKGRLAVDKVMARCAQQRARDLEVRRIIQRHRFRTHDLESRRADFGIRARQLLDER